MNAKILLISAADISGKILKLLKDELDEKGIDVQLLNFTKGKVLIVGALDTKGQEFSYLKKELEEKEIDVILMDVGVLGKPYINADITREEVARAGGSDINKLISGADRGKAIEVMMNGVSKITKSLYEENKISGIIGMGGTAGTGLASAAMQVVPIGVPKVIISTMACGDTSIFVNGKDINMIYSVTDILGLNSISRRIISNGAAALAGMVKYNEVLKVIEEAPLIATSMMGVTTECVKKAKEKLNEHGYEIIAFHAIGSGGKSMENIIDEDHDGLIKGVLDITTTEIANYLIGGVCSSGPNRLEVAGRKSLPQVVSCGALDFVNFIPNFIPEKYKNRKFHLHNPQTILMRTTKEENIRVAQIISEKLNKSKGKVTFFVPLRGFSELDAEGKDFYDPEADEAFVQTLENNLSSRIELVKCDNHINDGDFAIKLVDCLLNMIQDVIQ